MTIRWDRISMCGFGAFLVCIGYDLFESWEGYALIIWLAIHGHLPRDGTEQTETEISRERLAISHLPTEERKEILRKHDF